MKREILKRKFFGVAEENAGVAMLRSGRPNENAGIANENFFLIFFFAGIADGSTGIAEDVRPILWYSKKMPGSLIDSGLPMKMPEPPRTLG